MSGPATISDSFQFQIYIIWLADLRLEETQPEKYELNTELNCHKNQTLIALNVFSWQFGCLPNFFKSHNSTHQLYLLLTLSKWSGKFNVSTLNLELPSQPLLFGISPSTFKRKKGRNLKKRILHFLQNFNRFFVENKDWDILLFHADQIYMTTSIFVICCSVGFFFFHSNQFCYSIHYIVQRGMR